jgi:hypothetical protein
MVGATDIRTINLPYITKASNLKFNSTEKYVHAVWNQESADKGIYLASSSDSGKNFTQPKKIIETQGEVKDVQIIAKDEDIVITIRESVSGRDYLRAATGIISNDMRYEFKPCERMELDGEVINFYTTFTDDASEDHVYVKKEVTDKNKRGPGIDEWTQIHCSRLRLHQLLQK